MRSTAFSKLALACKKSPAFSEGHADIIIEIFILGRDLDGPFVFGDGVLPAALLAQADAQLVKEHDVALGEIFALDLQAVAQKFFGLGRVAVGIDGGDAA